MRVLVACESSGRVRDAFSARGHFAMSCDLLPSESPGPHYQGDVRNVLDGFMPVMFAAECDHGVLMGRPESSPSWDLVIAHPPCTFLTVSAAWAFKDPDFNRYPGVGFHQKLSPETLTGAARRKARDESVAFVRALYESADRVAIENPVGNLSKLFREPDQIIQPHQFGHDASKATCLWLKGLPLLKPTKHVPPRMVDGKPRWANQTDGGQNKLPPSADRWKLRAETYQGIADAMSQQWTEQTTADLFTAAT